ncbi:MAG: 1,4-dihydroxy-2-naphthoate polyprenyltransferase [Cyclobacteriaceae bacterium]
MPSAKVKAWISAFRLRTLPLALASIFLGSFIAAAQGAFDGLIFSLCVLTTLFLQILSNLANDYGDSIHGADGDHREGPSRAVQAGLITSQQMKSAMMVFGTLSFISGISLIYAAFHRQWWLVLIFLTLGLGAIYAAVRYTSGKNPYGYKGLGDLFVLLFFGLVGVGGSYFLFTQSWDWSVLLPATGCGLLAVGVLNVNNIRDIQSDALSGKRSIPVRIGRERAVYYHWILLLGALACAGAYTIANYQGYWQWLFVVTVPLLLINGRAVQSKTKAAALDPYLKQLAITTLLFVITFGLGLLLSS